MRRDVALLICAALLPYLPILSSSLLMDSLYLVPYSWTILLPGLENVFTTPIGGGFRPLTSVSAFWTAWFFEGSEIAHRSLNYAIHIAATLVTWRVGLRIGLSRGGALSAGLLFALSPCLAFAVPWISGRQDLLAGTFAGLVFLAHMRYREAASAGRLALVYLAVVMLFFSKEVGLLIPVLLFAIGRGHRRSYAPMLLIFLGWVALRMHFHALNFAADEEARATHDPLTYFREPDRMLSVLAGTGRQLFSLLTCAVGPWQLAGSGLVAALSSLIGWAMLTGLAAFRKAPVATAFGIALLIPHIPFLDRDRGYYLFSAAVFLLPVLVLTIGRLPSMSRKILIGALLSFSLIGCIHHVWLWHKASVRFREVVEPLRPLVETTFEKFKASGGRPQLVQVLGLPTREGPIWLFVPEMSPYALTGTFFPYYRREDLRDREFLQATQIFWRAGELTPEEEAMATRVNAERTVIDRR